ncbi:MAG: AGE family epimerase/isomerase [Clostridia bacterium]|nr:AGE family epimerase/isomerase [Clostridia bacterium]
MDYKKYLTQDILPFWLKNAIDKEFGGIMNQVDKYGNVINDEKNIWFIGRAMWSYAMAYRLAEPKEEYLNACETLFNFYDKCILPGNRLPHVTTRCGEAKSVRPVYYYSEMFAVMGCAQYYRICKNIEVWKRAVAFFDTVYDLYQKNKTTTQEIGKEYDCKTFGLHMAMLATTQFIRNAAQDKEKYNKIIDEIIFEMINGGYVDDSRKCVIEHIAMDGKMLPGDDADTFCPGHIFEAAWFVLSEGEYRSCDSYREFGKKLCTYAMPSDYEKHTEFIPTMCNLKESPYGRDDGKYIWWPQCEAVIAYRVLYSIYGENKYLEHANRIEKSMFKSFADFESGEWYCEIDSKGIPVTSDKGNLIKGPFHLPRFLLALISLEETGSILSYMS